MVTIKLQENQSLFDIAIQEYGSIEGLFEVLDENNINEVTPLKQIPNTQFYQELKISGNLEERSVVEYLVSREKKPATGLSKAELKLLGALDDCEGIGCMEIEHDFIVHGGASEKPKNCIEKLIHKPKNRGIGYMIISKDNIVN